jgi:hypothetical protein
MKTNLLFFLNTYNDLCQTTTPQLNNFKWTREINGVPYNLENSQQIQIPAGQTTSQLIPSSFSIPAASTTASPASASQNLTVASPTGVVAGQLIVGTGIAPGTTVESITGSVILMSLAATSSPGSTAINFYSPAAFIYLESDQQVAVIYNNGTPMALNPFEINGVIVPGVFFMNGPAYSLSIVNSSASVANVFFALMG